MSTELLANPAGQDEILANTEDLIPYTTGRADFFDVRALRPRRDPSGTARRLERLRLGADIGEVVSAAPGRRRAALRGPRRRAELFRISA